MIDLLVAFWCAVWIAFILYCIYLTLDLLAWWGWRLILAGFVAFLIFIKLMSNSK